jgi:hypothetical protein
MSEGIPKTDPSLSILEVLLGFDRKVDLAFDQNIQTRRFISLTEEGHSTGKGFDSRMGQQDIEVRLLKAPK